jgi:hypothetical protein
MPKKKYTDSIYSISNILSKKPILVVIHKGIKKGFLSKWYKENPAIHNCLMQLSEAGQPYTIIPWDGNGELLNHINNKNRRCILIFQDGIIKTDMDIKKLILLSNLQGWLLIQNDKIVNPKPNIHKDITGMHIRMLINDELRRGYQEEGLDKIVPLYVNIMSR